jgi:Uma2 family endonuclease
MSTTLAPPSTFETVADLLKRLGDIPPSRVRLVPTPGTATEKDVIEADDRHDRLCELVDGVLVEKVMGYEESRLTVWLAYFLVDFVRRHDLGIVSGADGTIRLMPGLVRIPDIAFVSWERWPRRKGRREPIPNLAPDLAVEVLSKGNTRKEMERKLREYFAVGVRLVWFVDPRTRSARVYTDPKRSTLLGEDQTLDGGAVLPGFTLSLRELFAELDR